MTKWLQRWLIAAWLACAAGGAPAQVDPDTAEQLMRQSGLWAQVDGLAAQVRAGFAAATAQQGRKPTPQQAERVDRAIDAAFSAERLRADVKAVLSQGLQPLHVQALQAWYATELGARIRALELAAAGSADPPAQMQDSLRKGSQLLQSMAEGRRTQIQDLVAVTQAGDLLASLAINTALAVQLGAQSVQPGAPSPPMGELRDQLQAQRPRLVQNFSNLMLATMAALYAPLSDAEFARYVDFARTDAGRHLNELGMKAFETALVRAANELGRRLPGAMDAANT